MRNAITVYIVFQPVFIDLLIAWSIDWLIFIDWLIDLHRLIDWLIFIDWLIDCVVLRLDQTI